MQQILSPNSQRRRTRSESSRVQTSKPQYPWSAYGAPRSPSPDGGGHARHHPRRLRQHRLLRRTALCPARHRACHLRLHAGVSSSSRWHLCSPYSGFITPDAMVSVLCNATGDMLSPQSRHLSRHYAGVLAWIGLAPCQCCAGAIALVVQASPPAMRWRLCPARAGAVAFLALATSPQSHWLLQITIVIRLGKRVF